MVQIYGIFTQYESEMEVGVLFNDLWAERLEPIMIIWIFYY